MRKRVSVGSSANPHRRGGIAQKKPSAHAMGTYVAGVVRRKNVPITTHDHQSLFDMALAPCLSGLPNIGGDSLPKR